MRIASLARKIKIAPTKVSDFAASIGVDMTKGTNSKLSDDQVQAALDFFNTSIVDEEIEVVQLENYFVEDAVEEPEEQPIVEQDVPESNTVAIHDDVVVVEGFQEDAQEPTELSETGSYMVEGSQDVESDQIEAPDNAQVDDDLTYAERLALDKSVSVIKPQKVKLQGLTVKGKIVLPEPKVKKPSEEKEQLPTDDPDKIRYTSGPDRKNRQRTSRQHNKRPAMNPIEAARLRKQKEEKRAEEKRQRELKARKTKHYQETVSKQPPSNHKKRKLKPVENKSIAAKSRSNNIFSKFWRWMNT